MAKKPDDPKKNAKDKHDPNDAGVGLPKPPPDSDVLDLGTPEEGPESSGISVVEWASLVEEPAADRAAGDPTPKPTVKGPPTQIEVGAPPTQFQMDLDPGEFHVDSPSDADILTEAVASLPPVAAPRDAIPNSDDAIDFGADIEVEAVASSAIDLPPDAVVDSGIDLSDVVVAESSAQMALGSSSGIDMGQDVIELAEEDVLAMTEPPNSSRVRLDDVVPAFDASSGVPAMTPGESGIDLIAEDVILEEPVSGSAMGSKRDLIAETLESGVDLMETNSKQSHTEEDALDDFLARVGSEDPSSAVDLGSAHTINVFKDEDLSSQAAAPSPSPSDIDLENVLIETSADVNIAPPSKKAGALAETEAIDLSGLAPSQMSGHSFGDIDIDEPVSTAKHGKASRSEIDSEVADRSEPAESKKDKKKTSPAAEKPAKPRGRAGAWLGGTMLGGLMTAAACAGVWVFAEPPREWRNTVLETVGMETPKEGPKGNGGAGKAIQPVITFANTADKIKSGDFEKITPDELAKLDTNDASQLVARAEVVWLNYVKTQRGKNLAATADPVVKAMADLTPAIEKGNADALFLRGQIHEMTGNAKAAEDDYKAGADKFKGDAEAKERFEAALLAMDIAKKTAGLLPDRVTPRMLAMALIQLQAEQPPPGGEPPVKPTDEAGFRFWQAIKAMRENKVGDALKLLDEARTRHDARRFERLRKPQNPLSDPREEIFLRACDELKEYWSLRGKLRSPGYLAEDNKNRDKDIDALAMKAAETGRAAQLKELGEKLAKDKPVAKADDLIKLLADEKKAASDKIGDLEKSVDDQKKALAKLEDEKKDANAKLKATSDLLSASTAREKDLARTLETANTMLSEVATAVNVKYEDAKKSGTELVRAVKDAERVSKMKDPQGTIRKLEGEQAIDRAKLKERWEPAEMLPIWLAILESDRTRSDLHPSIEKDLKRIENDSASKPIDKARATALAGLMLRNADKFEESKTSLEKAKTGLTDAKSKWGVVVDAALAEVSNPAAAYSRRAEELVAKNKPAEAVAVLKKALDIVPDKKGALYARRATIALDGARSKGPLVADDPAVTAARADADAAVKEGLAEGHFLIGRIAEETGNLNEALRSYRSAVEAHKAMDEDGSRYRVALARALLKTRAQSTSPRAAPPKDRTGKAAPKTVPSLDLLSVLLTLTIQAPGLPDTGPNTKEAEKLADEILALGSKAPFDARASALAIKGLYTRALNTYLEGLREKGLLAPSYANGLLDLVKEHPALKRPESLGVPDPTAGEKAYAAGLNLFAEKKYVEAEREFLAAIENDNGDGRYYYFLGLSRLAQGKRDAYEDFDTGARLERLGRPDRASVSQALERVQGPMRKALNDVRNRPVRDKGK